MYSTTVLYSRDHKGLGVTHEETSPKNQNISDNDEAGKTKPSD